MSASWPRLPLRKAVPIFSASRGRALFAGLATALVVLGIPALGPAPASGQSGPTLLRVNSVADASDSSVGDGQCRSFGGQCTLRAAIEESNALPGTDRIEILPGTYELEIPTVNEDSDASGDFDIRDSVTIVGTGADATSTILDGGFPPEGSPLEQRGMDRLLEIHPTALNVT